VVARRVAQCITTKSPLQKKPAQAAVRVELGEPAIHVSRDVEDDEPGELVAHAPAADLRLEVLLEAGLIRRELRDELVEGLLGGTCMSGCLKHS
jgi:hypothetical protein